MVMPAERQIETFIGADSSSSAPSLLAGYKTEIDSLQAVINSNKTDPDLIEPFVAELGGALKAVVKVGDGNLGITIPRSVEGFARTDVLVEDYGRYSDEILHRVVVPVGRITAINVLAFPVVNRVYRPVVDMRVQTSHDKPLSIHKAPDMTNPGKWHRFPLGLVGFSLEN